MWGALTDVKPTKLILMHENLMLTDVHTVGKAKIKNEEEVFAYPLAVEIPQEIWGELSA